MNGLEKLETCSNRSAGIVSKKIRICCNNFKDVDGYDCELRGIFPVTDVHCETCELYKGTE